MSGGEGGEPWPVAAPLARRRPHLYSRSQSPGNGPQLQGQELVAVSTRSGVVLTLNCATVPTGAVCAARSQPEFMFAIQTYGGISSGWTAVGSPVASHAVASHRLAAYRKIHNFRVFRVVNIFCP